MDSSFLLQAREYLYRAFQQLKPYLTFEHGTLALAVLAGLCSSTSCSENSDSSVSSDG